MASDEPDPTLAAPRPVPPQEGEGSPSRAPSLPAWGGGTARSAVGGAGGAAAHKASVKRARELRKSMTKEEVRLWLAVRELRTYGVHFRRQAPFLGYYLDFVCFAHRLVVEVDGSQHADEAQGRHDEIRDANLRRAGFRTLRFWNADVNGRLVDVVDTILAALEASPDQRRRLGGPTLAASRPVPPLQGEGGVDGEGGVERRPSSHGEGGPREARWVGLWS